jgi:7-carboxy-7-deazaguanine synthase
MIETSSQKQRTYTYSEIFHSIQGEGHYTGVPTAWVRFHLCNLQCGGFGQDQPTKPESWDLPHENFDVSSVTRVEDLPVWEKGCDSSYTWAKKYSHLMQKVTGEELAKRVVDILKTDSNPNGWFRHPKSLQHQHLCITGGEPLLQHSQMGFVELYKNLIDMDGGPIPHTRFHAASNIPSSVTWETNCTQKLNKEFIELVSSPMFQSEAFFSLSPKLWTVAGEKRSKAIKPEIGKQYWDVSKNGQLKFVVGSKEEQWDELDEVVGMFRDAGVDYPVWIMPVGAREEEQHSTAGDVAKMAYQRGYNVSGRMHVYLFGNAIGT